ncbi:MAG: hypothetical protein H2043_06585 [Rhizobiales bacterium]|nr:hypothetical protein [Hyphomicrobiales bacterium]
MTAKRLRSRRQRAFALVLLTMASVFIWFLIALVLLRSVQPASQFPL